MNITKSEVLLRQAICKELISLSKTNENITVLDSDLMSSSGLKEYRDSYPDRFYNCGIQEQNMIGVAGGLSSMGFKPFVHTFAAFASRRVLDQLYMLCGYANQNIYVLATDAGILNAANGATHMAVEDIAMMRAIPNATIIDFTDEVMVHALMPQILNLSGLVYMRVFRKTQNIIYSNQTEFKIGKANIIEDGTDVTIITSGALMVPEVLKATEALRSQNISCRVVDMFTVKPIDTDIILDSASKTKAIITVENHNVINGLGYAVGNALLENNINIPFKKLGVPDLIGETATIPFLLEKYNMNSESIINAVKNII